MFEKNPLVNDTDATAEAVQIALLRQAGMTKRLHLMLSLTQSTWELSRAAIRKQFSELSAEEQNLKLVELLYGATLARNVADYLAKRVQ